jgi:hypothetical protein
MAVPANTYKTYESKGNREQLSDVIYNIAPEDVPFLSNAGRGPKAESTFFEWQTDDLAAADTANAQLEGDDATILAATPTVRLGNYQQISTKAVSVSGTEEEVNKAGRKSELAYQVSKRASELKRDQEAILLSNQAANAGAAGTARKTGSLLAFVKTNVDKEATGANPVYTNVPNATRTDGALRSVTEAMLKNVIQLSWAQGGKPDTIMVGGTIKQAMSAFAGIATKTYQMTQAKTASIIGAADVYVSDFGTFVIVPNRFQRTRDVHVLDFELMSVRYLRPYRIFNLAKTGDSDKKQMLAEYGLQVNQEKGIGLIADVQP